MGLCLAIAWSLKYSEIVQRGSVFVGKALS